MVCVCQVLLSYAKSFFERMGVMCPTVVVLYRSGLNPGQEQRVVRRNSNRNALLVGAGLCVVNCQRVLPSQLASEQPKLHEYLRQVASDSKTTPNPKSAVHYVVVNKDPDTRAAMMSPYGRTCTRIGSFDGRVYLSCLFRTASINPLPGTCVDDALFGPRNKFLLWSTSAPRGVCMQRFCCWWC
jgi:hypothetical protein